MFQETKSDSLLFYRYTSFKWSVSRGKLIIKISSELESKPQFLRLCFNTLVFDHVLTKSLEFKIVCDPLWGLRWIYFFVMMGLVGTYSLCNGIVHVKVGLSRVDVLFTLLGTLYSFNQLATRCVCVSQWLGKKCWSATVPIFLYSDEILWLIPTSWQKCHYWERQQILCEIIWKILNYPFI